MKFATKFLISLWGLWICLYGLALRGFLHQILLTKDGSIYSLLIWFFPRIKTESYRFTPAFLIAKADALQFKWFTFLFVVWLLGRYRLRLLRWVSSQRLDEWGIRLFYSLALFFTADTYRLLCELSKIDFFFTPISFYWAMPEPSVLLVLSTLVMISGLMVIFGVARLSFSILFVMLFAFEEGLFFCFGKTNHQYAPLTYGLMVFPVYFLLRNSLSISILKVVVSLPYTLAGLEKLFSEPLLWLGEWEKAVVLIWQVSFVVGVFRLKHLYHFVGIGFHAAVALEMGIGFYVHPWQIGYVLFYDFSILKQKISKLCLTKR
jgi:hypothetical protein